MPPKFSIIIPVYNVAPYLRECLDSVLAQTFTDWEAICVDDGSTDGCGVILDEYAAKDKRFRVSHQMNAGVSAARNAALDIAKGEYFLFVDGDDVIASWTLSLADELIARHHCEGLLANVKWYRFKDGQELISLSAEFERRYSSCAYVASIARDNAELLCGRDAAPACVWGRIFSRRKFGDMKFALGVAIMEDFRAWVDALGHDAVWCEVDLPFYYYRDRAGSASHMVKKSNYHEVFAGNAYVLKALVENLCATEIQICNHWNHHKNYFWLLWRNMVREWSHLSLDERKLTLAEIQECFVSPVIQIPWSYRVMSRIGFSCVGCVASKPIYWIDRIMSALMRRVEVV